MQAISIFDQHGLEYDRWFDEHDLLYHSEVNALRKCIPPEGNGMEIGIGSGRFSIPFDIRLGAEPSRGMARIARNRKIAVAQALGEQLPFREDQFDFILLVTVICFVNNVPTLLQEVRRVLKAGERMILAFIDRGNQLGRLHQARKMNDPFYKVAHFYNVAEVTKHVQRAGFGVPRYYQTIFGIPVNSSVAESVREGYGEGAFVVLCAEKIFS